MKREVYDMGWVQSVLRGTGRHYALPLTKAITERRAELRGTSYDQAVGQWLAGEVSTVVLRDVICAPFREDEVVTAAAIRKGFRYPWHECWTALDTAMHRLRHPEAYE